MQKFSSSINQNITKEDDSITVTKEMTVSGVSSTVSINSALTNNFISFNFVTSIMEPHLNSISCDCTWYTYALFGAYNV